MKGIFATLLVFVSFALCMVATTIPDCKASVVFSDNDVGLHVPNPAAMIAANAAIVGTDNWNAEASATLHMGHSNLNADLPCPNESGTLRGRQKLPAYWEGSDSKASLCKAVNIYSQHSSAAYRSTKYGKGTKRLSCKTSTKG